MIKVIFDNNLSISGKNNPDYVKDVFSKNIKNLNKFIDDNKIRKDIEIYLSEVVFNEGLIELSERIRAKFKELKKASEQLNILLDDLSIREYDDTFLDEQIKNRFDLKIKENNIKIIPSVKIVDPTKLINRAVYYKPPFEKGDKGFKDTIIWLSVIEDSKNSEEGLEYLFVTEDKVFITHKTILEEEFKKESKKHVTIISADLLEVVLDSKLNLNIGLNEARKEIIEKIVKDTIFQNTLERKALKKLSEKSESFSMFSSIYRHHNDDWKSKVADLFYKDIQVEFINGVSKEVFEINANIKFSISYVGSTNNQDRHGNNLEDGLYSTSFVRSIYDTKPSSLEGNFTLSYNKTKKDLVITDIKSIGSGISLITDY